MLISDFKDYNSEKILKMILLHDLAESQVGDYIPGQISLEKKQKLEDDAFAEISKDLPDSVKSQYQKIWREYTAQISFEAKLVHQIDKLEMAMQAKTYQNSGYSKEKLLPFYQTAKKEISHPMLQKLFKDFVGDV